MAPKKELQKLFCSLPTKDCLIANKLLEKGDYEELQELVSSAITKLENVGTGLDDENLANLYTLQMYLI